MQRITSPLPAVELAALAPHVPRLRYLLLQGCCLTRAPQAAAAGSKWPGGLGELGSFVGLLCARVTRLAHDRAGGAGGGAGGSGGGGGAGSNGSGPGASRALASSSPVHMSRSHATGFGGASCAPFAAFSSLRLLSLRNTRLAPQCAYPGGGGGWAPVLSSLACLRDLRFLDVWGAAWLTSEELSEAAGQLLQLHLLVVGRAQLGAVAGEWAQLGGPPFEVVEAEGGLDGLMEAEVGM